MNNLFMFSIKNTEVNFLQNILEEIHQYLIKEIKPTDVSEIAIIKINDFLRTQKFNTNHENVSIYSKAIEEVLETLLLNLSNFSRRSLKINIEKQKQSLELMVKTFRGKLEMFKTTEESLKTNENNCSLESILEFDTIQSEKYHCLFENVKVVSLEALKNVSSGSNSLEFGYKFIKDMKSQINTCLQSIDVNNNFSKAVNLILDYENIINDLEDILNEYKYKDKNEKQINQMISLIVNKILTSTDHNLTNLSMLKDFQNSVDIFLLANQDNNNNFENFEERKKKKINPNELVSNIEATILRNVEENEMQNFNPIDKEYIDEFQEDNVNEIIEESTQQENSDEGNKNLDLANNNDINEYSPYSTGKNMPSRYSSNRSLTGAERKLLKKVKRPDKKGKRRDIKPPMPRDRYVDPNRISKRNEKLAELERDAAIQKSLMLRPGNQRPYGVKGYTKFPSNRDGAMANSKAPSAPPLDEIYDDGTWGENAHIINQLLNEDKAALLDQNKTRPPSAPLMHGNTFQGSYQAVRPQGLKKQNRKFRGSNVPPITFSDTAFESLPRSSLVDDIDYTRLNFVHPSAPPIELDASYRRDKGFNPLPNSNFDDGAYNQIYHPSNNFLSQPYKYRDSPQFPVSHRIKPFPKDGAPPPFKGLWDITGPDDYMFKDRPNWQRNPGNTHGINGNILYRNRSQRRSKSNLQTRNSTFARSKYETQNNAVDMYSKDDQLSKNLRKRCQSKINNYNNSKKYFHQEDDENKNDMCFYEFRDNKCELIDDLKSYKESINHMYYKNNFLKNYLVQNVQQDFSKRLQVKKSPRKKLCPILNEPEHINKLERNQSKKNDSLLKLMMAFLEAYKYLNDSEEKTYDEIKSIIEYLKLNTIEFNKSQREYNSEIIQKVTDINELFLNINNSLKLTNTKKIYWQIIKIIELIPNEIKNLHKLYIQNLNKRNLYKLNQNSDVSCNKINETFESLNENLKLSSKQIEIITNSDLFQNDNLFAGLSWVLKISEQYHYANAILLLSQKKFVKDILRNIMQENSINKDLNYFKNNCQDFVNIGDGKFGKVYRVTEKSTGNYFALKIYSTNSNSTVTLQFRNIINILKERYNLLKVKNNPFILQMLSSYKLDDLSYVLNFEFCPIKLETYHNLLQKFSSKQYEAELLWEGVNNEVPQTFKKAFQCYNIDFAKNSLVYIFELYCILDFLADCNIIHMDIKTTNIMIGENLHLKLVDFGCITNFDLIQQLNIHENEDLEQSKNFETKSYRDIEIMCGDINDMYPKGYDYYKTSADSGMKNALILKADVLSDLWSMTICAIHLLLNGYSFNLSIPSNIIKEMKLQKLPNTPNYSNCQCEYFMFQICMNKTLFEQFIVNGLQKTGGEEYKSLMNFFISVFNLRNFRAIDYVKCRSNSSINESKMLKMIDIKKVENIEIFLKHNINLDTIYNFEFDSKLKNLLFSDDHVISYSTFDEFSKSLKNLSTDESNLGNDIEIQH